MSKVDANDIAAQHGPVVLAAEAERLAAAARVEALASFPSVTELVKRHGGRMRQAIIHGLVRRGEVINIIAPPKSGKTWLAYHMAICVASGGHLLGITEWKCEPGPVVIFDNELHEETSGARIPMVLKAMDLPAEILDRIYVVSLRGKLVDINTLAPEIAKAKMLKPKMVILDALYRFIPKGMKENDNADATAIMNTIDNYGAMLETAAIGLVHHTSKGSQGETDLMDVGAGAGAFARATDNHMAVRPHEDADHYIIEAQPRSFKKPEKIVCEWAFPLWWNVEGKNPDDLKGKKKPKSTPVTEVDATVDPSVIVAPALNEKWMSTPELVAGIASLTKRTQKAAEIMVKQLATRYDLRNLKKEDGVRAAGCIYVMRDESGPGLLYSLKGKT
ncbi:MAG: AAA family ATPase [Sterolibacterium sp.]